jgi:hypothetical protein
MTPETPTPAQSTPVQKASRLSLDDALALIGLVLAVVGVGLKSLAAAFCLAGVCCIVVSLFISGLIVAFVPQLRNAPPKPSTGAKGQ